MQVVDVNGNMFGYDHLEIIGADGKPKTPGGGGGPYVPYTGATGNVDLGEYELKAGQLEFDQTPTGTAGVAVMRWNDQDGTVDLGLKGGNVTLQVGQEQVTRVVNKTGSNLLEANYQAVRISGAQGNRLKVDLAQANNDANSADTIGIVTETINDNQEGFVTTSGLVRNIDTTGSLQSETWADGDLLYLSGTIAGQITNIKPSAPIHTVIMGYVVRAHSTQGQIYVKVDNGYELDELHNVAITTPLNDQVLQYESATSLWKNKTISTGITIGTTAITSGTVGRVLFQGAGNVVQQSSSLFWDATNNRLGVGTSTPASTFEVVAGSDANGIKLRGRLADNISNLFFSSNDGLSQYGYFQHRSSVMRVVNNVGDLEFWNGPNNGSTVQRATLFGSTGNFAINTTTDAGFRLDVNGTARVQGKATFGLSSLIGTETAIFTTNSATNSFIRIYNSNTTIGSTSGIVFTNNTAGNSSSAIWGDSLDALGNTNLRFQTSTAYTSTNRMIIHSTGNVGINTTTDAGFRLDVNGTARVQNTLTVGATAIISSEQAIISNSGAQQLRLYSSATAIGTQAQITFTTNTFGSVSCAISAISLDNSGNQTLSFSTSNAGTTSERMRITNNGNVLIGTTTNGASRLRVVGLPTSSAGLSTGDIWNDAGTLKIV